MSDLFGRETDLQTDFCITAGAGTGKTYALVELFMKELTTPLSDKKFSGMDQIVAITFTEKAALEMKTRIRTKMEERIRSLSLEFEVDGENQGQGIIDSKLLDHLKIQRQKIQHSYISTIHSFCLRLLRENLAEAGIDPEFSVMDETAANTLLSNSIEKCLLDGIRSRDESVLRLISEYGLYDSGKFFGGSIITFLRDVYPLLRTQDLTGNTVKQLTETTLEKLKDKERHICIEIHSIIDRLLLIPEEKEAGNLSDLKVCLDQFSNNSFSELKVELSGLITRIKSRKRKTRTKELRNDLELLGEKITGLISFLDLKTSQPLMNHFFQIIQIVHGEYFNRKRSFSLLDFEDLEEMAVDLLRRHPAVRSRYQTQFIRILIDEFQDVNVLQHRIINFLAPVGSGRLFVVGDKKQSIYGFRGADVNLFSSIEKSIQKSAGTHFFLTENRRSRPHLIQFINDFFSKTGEKEEDDTQAFFGYDNQKLLPTRTGSNNDKIERLKPIGEGNAQQLRQYEANLAAVRILNLIDTESDVRIFVPEGDRSVKFKDIVLLFRAFTDITIYQEALRKKSIPYIVVKGRGFYQSQEILDVIHFLSYLDRPGDTLSLIGVLRSPLVGISDPGLAEIGSFLSEKRKTLDRLFLKKKTNIFETVSNPSDKEKLKEFLGLLDYLRTAKDSLLISELIERIIQRTHFDSVLAAQFLGEQKLANLFKLIELARTFENGGNVTLTHFIETLIRFVQEEPKESLAPVSSEYENAVRLMTIHQSKGLEFPVVFLMDLGRDPTGRSGRMEFHPEFGIGLQVQSQKDENFSPTALTKEIHERNLKKERDEHLRLLYVAITRARDHLVLSGTTNKKNPLNWANMIDRFLEERQTIVNVLTDKNIQEVEEKKASSWELENPDQFFLEKKNDGKIIPWITELFSEPTFLPSRGSFNATSLSLYFECSRRYFFDKVQKIDFYAGEPSISFGLVQGDEINEEFLVPFQSISPQDLGSLVHRVLEQLDFNWKYSTSDLKKILKLKNSGSARLPLLETSRNIHKFLNSKLGKTLQSIPSQLIQKEQSFQFRITEDEFKLDLRGTIDLCFQDVDGYWNVVDYKYEKKKENHKRYSTQLKIYGLALAQFIKTKQIRLVAAYLKEDEKNWDHISFGPKEQRQFKKSLVQSAKQIMTLESQSEDSWPKISQSKCRQYSCPYIQRCYKKRLEIHERQFSNPLRPEL